LSLAVTKFRHTRRAGDAARCPRDTGAQSLDGAREAEGFHLWGAALAVSAAAQGSVFLDTAPEG
jgi:hypothetical protein